MRPLVIIPARGGSKGVPSKNIKLLNGNPLIYYTIDAARALFDDSLICVSTDSINIKLKTEEYGLHVPELRPKELATDTTSTYDVLLYELNRHRSKGNYADIIILLQPTSPFRTAKQIQEAIFLFSRDLDMVVSVKESKSNPYFNLFEEGEDTFLQKSKTSHAIRRQDCPKVWEYNGAIYIINVESLLKTQLHHFRKVKKYEMDEYSSWDIDTELDFLIAEVLIKEKITL